jgi:membrane fusion protein (multidrug efflux system)
MSDTLRKVLAGAVVGALLVAFVGHVRNERAKRAPVTVAGPTRSATAARDPEGGEPTGSGSRRGAGAPGQAPIAVVAVPARVERMQLEIEALGTAHANESIDVTAKVSNLVSAVRFTEGQQVQRGDLLVELDSAQARADLAIAQAALTESRNQFDRSRELYATRALSESQLDQIEAALKANEARVAAAQSRLGDNFVRAPFAGRVCLRRVSVGSLVSPGTVITTLDDTRTIKLDFTVSETGLSAVTPGLQISARSVAYPDETFAGKVASVDSRVDPATRSVTVRAVLPNPDGLLKPGMFLTVRLSRGETDALLVPEEALVPEQGEVFVFVVRDGAAEKRTVRLGQRRVGDVQVLEGVVADELVVTEGTQRLRDGDPVSLQPPATPAVTAS